MPPVTSAGSLQAEQLLEASCSSTCCQSAVEGKPSRKAQQLDGNELQKTGLFQCKYASQEVQFMHAPVEDALDAELQDSAVHAMMHAFSAAVMSQPKLFIASPSMQVSTLESTLYHRPMCMQRPSGTHCW